MNKDKPGMLTPQCVLKTVDGGIRCMPAGIIVTAYAMSDRIIIKGGKKLPQVVLPYERTQSFGVVTDYEQKGKSAVGRAAAGGLLFGPLGAVVGAASGAGSKTVEKNTLVVYFVDGCGRDLELHAEIVGKTTPGYAFHRFANELKKHVKYLNAPDPELAGKTVEL